ncbi:MAG: hypothetical protein D6801_01200, partial [Alphaproteobacteria bacterium]
AQAHRAQFHGVPKGPGREYVRRVSVPVDELPADWRATLRRLQLDGAYTPSIMQRMTHRLGLFTWSAQRAGRPVDLADTEALRVLYRDLRQRSIDRQIARARKQGLEANITEPRWAYLRSAWEELYRFARAHGLPDAVCDQLRRTQDILAAKERRQSSLKKAQARKIGTRADLLVRAEGLLAEAETASLPQMRHALRNRAAAIALGCAVPARPADVAAHHVFGRGLFHEPERNRYRFRYHPRKTRGSISAEIDIPLDPWWNRFIDALILQDHHPSYLGALRAKVIAEHRPLYVQYDGSPAAYAWYSRMWSLVTGAGGHIARTLAYDDTILMGAEGALYGRVVNGHSPTSRAVRAYESDRLARERIRHSQATMAALFGDDDAGTGM